MGNYVDAACQSDATDQYRWFTLADNEIVPTESESVPPAVQNCVRVQQQDDGNNVWYDRRPSREGVVCDWVLLAFRPAIAGVRRSLAVYVAIPADQEGVPDLANVTARLVRILSRSSTESVADGVQEASRRPRLLTVPVGGRRSNKTTTRWNDTLTI